MRNGNLKNEMKEGRTNAAGFQIVFLWKWDKTDVH